MDKLTFVRALGSKKPTKLPAALLTTGILSLIFTWASLDEHSHFGVLPLIPTLIIGVLVGCIGAVITYLYGLKRQRWEMREISAGLGVSGVITLLIAFGVPIYNLGGEGHPLLGVHLPIDGAIAVSGTLLMVGLLVATWGEEQATPTSLVLMGVGMLIGMQGSGGLGGFLTTVNASAIASLALVIILFDGGLGTTKQHLNKGLVPGLVLSSLGVVITAFIVGGVAHLVLGMPPILALLLGAALSPTDAAAVLALLKEIPLPSRASAILRIESGTNDPVAIMLTAGLLVAAESSTSPFDWAVFGFGHAIGGLVTGVVLGFVGAKAIDKVSHHSPNTAAVLGVGVALMVYGGSVMLGASGFLASYIAGIVVRSHEGVGQVATTRMLNSLGIGSETLLFLLLGVMTNPATLVDDLPAGVLLAIVLLLVARPVAGMVSLSVSLVPWRESAAISWLGLRGAVPIVLATVVMMEGASQSHRIFNIVFIVVVISLLVQTFTASPLLNLLDLPGDEYELVEVDALPLEGVDPKRFAMYQVRIPASSQLIEKELWEVPPPSTLRVVSIGRDDETLIPRGSTRFEEHDLVVVSTDDPSCSADMIKNWIDPEYDIHEADSSS